MLQRVAESVLQCVAESVLQCVAEMCGTSALGVYNTTEWRTCMGHLIFMGYFPQKSPVINGSFAKSTHSCVLRTHLDHGRV